MNPDQCEDLNPDQPIFRAGCELGEYYYIDRGDAPTQQVFNFDHQSPGIITSAALILTFMASASTLADGSPSTCVCFMEGTDAVDVSITPPALHESRNEFCSNPFEVRYTPDCTSPNAYKPITELSEDLFGLNMNQDVYTLTKG